MKKRILNMALLTFGLSLLYFFIYRVGIDQIWQIIKGANLFFCLVAVFIYLGAIALHASKWYLWGRILRPGVSFKDVLPFYLANSLIGNLTPFKSGEAAMPFFLKKFFKTSLGRGLALIILDRFSELLVFMLVLIGAVYYLIWRGLPGGLVFQLFFLIFAFLILVFGLIFAILFFQSLTIKVIKKIAKIKILRRSAEFIEKEVLHLYEGITLASKEKIYGRVIGLTFLAWIFELIASYFIFLSVARPFFLDIIASQAVGSAVALASFIPSGFGIGEISQASLLNLMGYPLIQMAGAIILGRVFLTGTLFSGGLLGFYFMKEKREI